jgi:hypothetical protein
VVFAIRRIAAVPTRCPKLTERYLSKESLFSPYD